MKKIVIFIIIYTIFLCVPIQAKSENISYRLYLDSDMRDVHVVKDEFIKLLDELFDSLEEDSYGSMLVSSIPYLEDELDAKISYRNGILYVKMGDKKGALLKGKYQKEELCIKRVEPRSKLQEFFDF